MYILLLCSPACSNFKSTLNTLALASPYLSDIPLLLHLQSNFLQQVTTRMHSLPNTNSHLMVCLGIAITSHLPLLLLLYTRLLRSEVHPEDFRSTSRGGAVSFAYARLDPSHLKALDDLVGLIKRFHAVEATFPPSSCSALLFPLLASPLRLKESVGTVRRRVIASRNLYCRKFCGIAATGTSIDKTVAGQIYIKL